MSRGPFQTNLFNDFIYFLVWSMKPEKPVLGIHKTWHLCRTIQLSTFCLCTIKWSKVTVRRERAVSKAFSCPSNFICASSPALVLYWEKGKSGNQFSPVELKLKLLPLAWTQTELGKDWCHHPIEEGEALPKWGAPTRGHCEPAPASSQANGFQNKSNHLVPVCGTWQASHSASAGWLELEGVWVILILWG